MRKQSMRQRLLNACIKIFPKGAVAKEIRDRIKRDFPGHHLARNPIGSGRKKKVEVEGDESHPSV